MSEKPPQFFAEPRTIGLGSNRAVYRLPAVSGKSKKQDVHVIVECIDGSGNAPRNATSAKELMADLAEELDLQKEFEVIAAIAKSMREALDAAKPQEIEVEFGIELGGELGVPMISKGEAKANFKITLKWGKK